MAYEDYTYDAFGTPVAPVDPLGDFIAQQEEEERRRREEEARLAAEEEARKAEEAAAKEAANTEVQTHEVKTYADGSKTVSTTQEIPAGQRAVAYPVAPSSGDAMGAGGVVAQSQPARQTRVQPVAPGSLGIDQSQYTAQQESGNRPNIGYHGGKSSAYGTYGITAPAYKDVQQANPAFAGRDISTLTPEEQRAAYQTFTELNAQRLKQQGVEPTAANQRLAHLLGANGAARFLATGQVSPAAAAANGGEENLKRIARQRLGAGPAPASAAASPVVPTINGADQREVYTPPQEQLGEGGSVYGKGGARYVEPVVVGQEQPQPEGLGGGLKLPAGEKPTTATQQQIENYQAIQNDPMKLLQAANDDTTPKFLQERARNRAADLLTAERDKVKAEERIKSATPSEAARIMSGKPRSNFDIMTRALMFNYLGLKEAATAEFGKLDSSATDKMVMGPDGNAYMLQVRGDGSIVSGINADGKQLSQKELIQVGAGISTVKGAQQHGSIFNDPTGTVKGSWVLETRPGSTPVYKEVGTGRVATAEESALLAKAAANKDQLASARTQATHAYTSTMTTLTKEREKLTQLGASEDDLRQRGLDLDSIQRKAQAAGNNVMTAATQNYGAPTGRLPANAPVTAVNPADVKKPSDQPAVAQSDQPGANPAPASVATKPTEQAQPTSILDNWKRIKPGESTSNFQKRTQYTQEDIESEAKQLVAGDKTLTEITGRDAGLLRHYASARAKELDPTWSATDSNARRDALKRWTNPDSSVSKQVRAHITAANSIQDVKDAFAALQNGNLPLFNQIKNDFEKNTGKPLPVSAETGAMILGPEIIKSMIPGGGGVAERLEAKHLMGIKLSPAQQKAVFDELEAFQGNSLKALETDWTRAKLPKDQFRERVLGGSPAAQELYDSASKHQSDRAALKAGVKQTPSRADVEAEMRKRGLLK